MLQSFGPDIWISDGPVVNVAGFHYPTRMAAIKCADGGLFIWSPIQLSRELADAVDQLGPVHFLVAPNSLHHLAIGDWANAYPKAQLFAAPGLSAKRKDLTFGDTLSDSGPWAADIDQITVLGNAITTEVVFFHKASKTVLFTDLIQQFPKGFHKGWRGIVANLDLMTGNEAQVPRKFRMAFTNRSVARASVRSILVWPADKVIMAHGQPITSDGQAFLKRAFAWLKP
jgi:hypothetical protein